MPMVAISIVLDNLLCPVQIPSSSTTITSRREVKAPWGMNNMIDTPVLRTHVFLESACRLSNRTALSRAVLLWTKNLCVHLHGRQLPLHTFCIGVLLWNVARLDRLRVCALVCVCACVVVRMCGMTQATHWRRSAHRHCKLSSGVVPAKVALASAVALLSPSPMKGVYSQRFSGECVRACACGGIY